MANSKKKNKISNYNTGTIIVDIVMLFLGLIFFIGTLAGKGDDIAAGFVRIVGGVLIAVGIFELINFLRIKDKTLFDTVVLIIASAIAIVGLVFIINPLPVITVFNFIFGIIIAIYAVVIIISAVGTLRSAGAKYWWFSLIFGLIALALGLIIIFFNFATKVLTLVIGITLVVGSVGGMANAILASQAKKEYKANSKILEDATFTVDSTKTDESTDDSSDSVKY